MLSLVYAINRLMWKYFTRPIIKYYYVKKVGYCYHSVNVIIFGRAQSDHIKRLLLYYKHRRKQKENIKYDILIHKINYKTQIFCHILRHSKENSKSFDFRIADLKISIDEIDC